jgi:predicted nuclease with TOPRIM domain
MDNQQQEVVNPEVSKDVKTKSTEATENVLSPNVPYHRFSELTENYRELEEKFDGLVKEQESARQKKLQEEGKYQELIVEKDKTIEQLSQDNKDKSEYQGLRRDMLLSELSDEDKKAFGNLPLIQLEMLVAKFSKEQRKNVPDVPGAINEGEAPKDWVNMPDDERRANWNRVLQTYMRK